MDTLVQGLHECERGARYVEVHDRGDVTRVLGIRESRSGLHEGFIFAAAGATYTVEDNADITGVIPLRRGEALELQGQLECNDDVIHWTHRDPAGRHIAGYIIADGRTYQ